MSSTYKNVVSNFIARLWSIGIGIYLIPFYIDILGIEAYGLVGFFGTLTAALSIFDMGLTTTLSRQLAISKELAISNDRIRNIVFSMECLYWAIGLILSIIVILGAPLITNYWVNSNNLESNTIELSIILMGMIIAFQWPQSLYGGGLLGLEKHVHYNVLNIVFNTFKSVGVIFALKYFEPTVKIFFIWHLAIALLYVLSLRFLLWRLLPNSLSKVRFSIIELKLIANFVIGMTGVGITSFLLTQIDKIVLSKILSLEEFGYYTLAWTVGNSILILVGILAVGFIPKINQVVAAGNQLDIIKNFHKNNSLVTNAVLPLGVFIATFSYELILLWTQNIETTIKIYFAVSLLSVGSIFNAILNIPYHFMIAYGKTRYTIYQNLIASFLFLPLLLLLSSTWKLNGAAFCWLILNILLTLISLPICLHLIPSLKGEIKQTFLSDFGKPLFVSLIISSLFKSINFENNSIFIMCLYFLIIISINYVGVIIVNKEIWNMLRNITIKTKHVS